MIRVKAKKDKEKEKVRIGLAGESVEAPATGRRQTPGEIRIQSGESLTNKENYEDREIFLCIKLIKTFDVNLYVILQDVASLDAGRIAEASFPNPQDLTNFLVVVNPDEGFWKGARYEFTFSIPPTYPHDPPKVHCTTKIFHPNINLEGQLPIPWNQPIP